MATTQMQDFFNALKQDKRLQDAMKAAADADAVVQIAKEAGFSISLEDMDEHMRTSISDEELEAISGGTGGFFNILAAGFCGGTNLPNTNPPNEVGTCAAPGL